MIPRRHVSFAAVLGLVTSLNISASVAAAAGPASPAAGGRGSAVTVVLKAPRPAALARLAQRHDLSHAQRVAAVDRLLPTPAAHQAAVAALTAEGLTVTGESSWTVSATAPAATVRQRFGRRPSLPARPTPAQRRAATGPLPTLPAALQHVASGVYPTTTGPAVFHHSALAGADFRNAYTTPSLTAAGTSPYDGQDIAGNLTIATIQLAGWNSSDLATYAASAGDSTFDPATDLTQVPVDQATVPGPDSGDDSDVEVDLDQEAILSTDPYAHQRAYFAPNTTVGYADAFTQVLDDTLQNAGAYHGGDPSIAALSVSWGECEADTGQNQITRTLEPIMQSLVAAGVTIFASSGDDGIYDDCQSARSAVDYPASSPEVVGVGATALSAHGGSAANDGSNWSETAWSCGNSADCRNNGGSGGGASAVFAAPSYQASAIRDAPFAAPQHRLVPDIAADGDPDTGFTVYTSDPTDVPQFGHTIVIGGTSLAAPLSAAVFTNALAAYGAATGVGDIHDFLYLAYAADDGAFRDITSGSNGSSFDAATDPSVTAQAGYDTVGGLGAALWPAIVELIYAEGEGNGASSLSLNATTNDVTAGHSLTLAGRLLNAGQGLAGRALTLTATSGGVTATSTTTTASDGTWSLRLRPQRTATYRVSFAGSAGAAAATSGFLRVTVHYDLTLTKVARVKPGSKRMVARGTLTPADSHVAVTVWRVTSGGARHKLATGTTSSTGAWTARWRLHAKEHRVVATVAAHPLDLAGTSRTVKVP